MENDDLLLLRGQTISSLLAGKELDLIQIVREAYEAHGKGKSSLPHSTFLRFPDDDKDRIIALPAYLGDGFAVAGIKWMSSFPGNLARGMDRASAVLILNSTITGRPEAILEGSIISAKRTAASAALAAKTLLEGKKAESVGMVGCGFINYEIAQFLLAVCPELKTLRVFDLSQDRANQFKRKCENLFENVEVAKDISSLLGGSSLITFATTASKPHLFSLSDCAPGSIVLHISLRDLAPGVILSSDNIVDDADHVCRAQTSIHLAEQVVGSRDFIRCSLAEILLGKAPARSDSNSIAVFSPFGLGVLDIAVGKFLCGLAAEEKQGTLITSFLPPSWLENEMRADEEFNPKSATF